MGKNINFAFLGATKYSEELLKFLIKNGLIPKVIFYIPKKFKIKIKGIEEEKINSNYADLTKIAKQYNIPCYEVNSVEGKRLKDYKETIKNLNLDLLLVLGWYYMIPKEIRDLAKYGAWGIHASLLPKYAGGAPLVWAIINGEKKAGVTLFRMEDGVDNGDIIYQKEFNILFSDTIKDVYKKVTFYSKKILLETFKNFDKVSFMPQDKSKIEVFPQRSEKDGLINWNDKAINIYNFIRAQTIPYPCAYSFLNNQKIKIVNVKITNKKSISFKNGKIIKKDNKFLVATKDYFLEIGYVIIKDKKYGFKNFARAKRVWGGYSGTEKFKKIS